MQRRTNSFFSYRARHLARKLLAGVLIPSLLVTTIVTPAQAAVFTPGESRVSETGAATYTIPLQVPPGTAGMVPKLSLVYNSQAGNGLLGVGWSLSGLSAVARCGRTIAQDGVNSGVQYDNSDRYCLDGQRLIAINGAYGADSTEYRTERESFAKIVSYGTAGNGPAWFKAWTKSGQILEFGNTADSRIEAQGKTTVRVWALNKVSDTKGNYLTVTYTEDSANGDYYPARIDYTGNAAASPALTPDQSVQFVYATRPDVTPFYQAGSLIKNTVRMTNIKTYIGGSVTLVKDYQLVYANSTAPNNASRVTTVTECAGDGVSCLPATSFGWQPSQGSYTFAAPVAWGAFGVYAGSDTKNIHTGDFNGDGRADLFFSNGNWFYVQYSNGNGFDLPIGAGSDFSYCYYDPNTGTNYCEARVGVGDVNGDGRADIIKGDGTVMLSTGSGFAAPVAWGAFGVYAGSDTKNIHTGDFNGDGRADLFFSNGNWFYVQYSNGNGFDLPIGAGSDFSYCYYDPNTGTNYCEARVGVGDVNGDGRADIIKGDGTAAKATAPTPDLLTAITTGLGGLVSIAYKPLTDGTVYTRDTNAVYPIRDIDVQGPLYVVASAATSDGIGGNYATNYAYAGAKADLSGRGFLGFRQTQVTNTATGLKAQSTFRQDWPYVGLPSQVKRMKSGGSVLSQVDTTYGCTDFVSVSGCTVATGRRYFPYLAQSVEASGDLNGAVFPTVTTTNQFDNYGNATQITVTTSDGYSKITANTFTNDTLNWFLGRLTRATVTSTTP